MRLPVVSVHIQVLFTALGLMIDEYFIVLEKTTPTMMSLKDMIPNGIKIIVQHRYIIWKGRKKVEVEELLSNP